MTDARREVHRACTLCEAMCGLTFTVEGQRVVRVAGDVQDPFSRGFCCPKGVAAGELHHDPDRLRRPLLRRPDGRHEEVDWEEALAAAGEGLARVLRHGPDALAVYLGNPVVHDLGALAGSELLRRLLPSRNRYTANSQDGNPHLLANYLMFGAQLSHPVPDLDRTRYLLLLGANPVVSGGSFMTAPRCGARLRAIQARGGKVVVVDPRRSETARLADEHLAIRPGADALLLLALARTLVVGDRWDRAFLDRWAVGHEALPRLLEPFAPERVAPHLGPGWDAALIRRLADELSDAPSAAVYGRLGLCSGPYAGLAAWALNLLNVVSGHLDRPGGMMFPDGPASRALGEVLRGSYDRYRSPQGCPEVLGEYPARHLAEQIERGRRDPGAPEAVHGLLVLAGNPVLSVPGADRLEEALRGLECLVSIDIYPSETARLAHVVLPPRSSLHDPHFEAVFTNFSVEDTARWSPPVLPPPPDSGPSEFELIVRLAQEVVRRAPAPRRRRDRLQRALLTRLAAQLTPERLADLAVRFGPGGRGLRPLGTGWTLERLRAQPRGLPPRPLAPRLAERLRTRGRRIVLTPGPYVADLPRLVARLDAPPPAEEGLVLIGRRQLRGNNSWFHNLPSQDRADRRCLLQVHPLDAARLGLEERGRATLKTATGEAEVEVQVTDDVSPGVVSLPHGWGHQRHGGRLAGRAPGVNLNALLPAEGDPLTGNAVLSGVPVALTPVAVPVGAGDAPRLGPEAGAPSP